MDLLPELWGINGECRRMRRLIDADALWIAKFVALQNDYAKGWNDAIDAIMENQPTEYAVPIIRCRECRYRDDVGRCELNDLHWVNGEDFCSWAESIIRCKNCKWFVNSKCTIYSLTNADDNSYCPYAEPKESDE
jgi:hypothetical protein